MRKSIHLLGGILCILSLAACSPPDGNAVKTQGVVPRIEIDAYADAAKEPIDIDTIHIANVLFLQGDLKVVVIQDRYRTDLERLRIAVDAMKAKETLPLETEHRTDDGRYVLGEIQVDATKMPEYVYAVEQALTSLGFYGEVFLDQRYDE